MIDHNKVRGELVYRRTYSRPTNDSNTVFETWDQTVKRVIRHQVWLWERQIDRALNHLELSEIEDLEELLLSRKASMSGRTLWLGGTEVAKKNEISQFNCTGLITETVSDFVDMMWCLLNGAGVGFKPEVGTLNGFSNEKEIIVVRSNLTERKLGVDDNIEYIDGDDWVIKVGDSAKAWAKAFGKLIAGKNTCNRLIIDLSNIRPAGIRLKGYGWISSGDNTLSTAMVKIAEILNNREGMLLTRMNMLDIGNWMGTVLSSRRSAEIVLHTYGDPETEEFIYAKKDAGINNPQRYQSNNSLLFYSQPTKLELRGIFELIVESGGSEPAFINAKEALKRAPWFKVGNPCFEVLLGNKNMCNLVELNLEAFNDDLEGLYDAQYLLGRANYRQTCVNIRDGILQHNWQELNEYLRLTGMGVTGIVGWEYTHDSKYWQQLKRNAIYAVNSMADELNLPRSKNCTTIKPSGTLSKMMGCSEGIHKPLGKYIFNNIIFSRSDPLVYKLRNANYSIIDHPQDDMSVIVKFPILWKNIDFEGDDTPINTDSAIIQLERYKLVMDNYVEQNCSVTISYDINEIPEIVNWLDKNWDSYVGVSWLFRDDPSKTAADLGYDYLPQEVVTKTEWYNYADTITELDFTNTDSLEEISIEECAGGVCPVK